MDNLIFGFVTKQAVEGSVVVAVVVFILIAILRLTNKTTDNNQNNMVQLLDLLHDMVTQFNQSLKELNAALYSLKDTLNNTNHTIEMQYDGAIDKLNELKVSIDELHVNVHKIQVVTDEIKAEAITKIHPDKHNSP